MVIYYLYFEYSGITQTITGRF